MKRSYIYILFFMFAFLSAPVVLAQDQQKPETLQDEQPQVVLTVTDTTIRVQNATPATSMEIYNILGVKVKTERINSSDQTISLSDLPKGYYIIKLGTVVRKIVIR